ncbi:hypothetical protein CC1G_03998 [Coprinopsis cinerea okayama7|uniref:Uncharacterized protein n=1 Tax=Coprinopsis cinerea (strain Okayama-7 / 130 / ATCC MYA-4618 / FGSC 9003) TaxID=240176 RepID=A8N8F1_COPC7|nr:hypothetical protein CC1G_03998 [Coprinopsis cinerea okayama7\|eukprot:XP_001831107.2 hypothetical protein CC1G_03998 [Coprinopsis cinerea okayama7\
MADTFNISPDDFQEILDYCDGRLEFSSKFIYLRRDQITEHEWNRLPVQVQVADSPIVRLAAYHWP